MKDCRSKLAMLFAAATVMALAAGCASSVSEESTEEVGASEDAVTVSKCPKSYELSFKNVIIYGGFDHGGIDDDQIDRVNAVRTLLQRTSSLSANVRRVDARQSVCHYENVRSKAAARLFTKGGNDSLAVDLYVPGSNDEWVRIYVPAKKSGTSYVATSGASVPIYASAYYSHSEGAEGLKRIGVATLK